MQKQGRFATTHWSLVLAAARDDDVESRRAFGTLCEQYWYPLYAFVRRWGHPAEDAQDLTQAFLARLLEKRDFGRASPDRGPFRAFLLASLKNFLHNETDRVRAVKRGGRTRTVSIDLQDAEGRYVAEPVTRETPDDHFNRKWALTVLDRALLQLRGEYERADKSAVFPQLAALMTGNSPHDTYREAAADLGMSEGAVKVAVHRMRRRFRDLLREEIAATVDPRSVDEEIQFLIRAVGDFQHKL